MRRATAFSLPTGVAIGAAGAVRFCSAAATASAAPSTPPPPSSAPGRTLIRNMRPRELMRELDNYIIGQNDAKKAVAVALRNRWRRHQVGPELREEIAPKNILMIGPTGVGKTEIARRLAKLVDAPFVKVEATKFTEVGFHGRDVESIIEDLYKASLTQTKQNLMRQNEAVARQKAEDRILKALAGVSDGFREHLRSGALDDIEVMVELQEKAPKPKTAAGEGVFIAIDLPGALGAAQTRTVKKVLKIKDALPAVQQEELEKMVDTEDVSAEALRACEEDGIVVIDEIDKIVTASGGYKGHQASAEGVQQDLLPLVEGTTVSTKFNVQIKTDKILFICSGAFHSVKPSDMLAELQGRLPIRVELKPLTSEDFHRIITEPKYNLIKQHVAMMETEGVKLVFTEDALWEIANVAAHINSTVQNIGARRLITITEKVVEEISFDGPDRKGETFVIDAAYVNKAVENMVKKVDIKKFLL
ncbi:putative heat shock protein HslVU, ATPase subunit HslU [Trypanosoma conorhini]|uniref:Putative heat shock protein HslVU, ATPase subunit HslU n=1 Tax=Trypanosoma conorhini TaxID=83891 RepID=A0A3R7L843_9TRYP|nr:putative heat shock protein HslVU, ATPase subunit HslU [Trypanosoma conorhini]RNF21700.1 putative heat shock protein HslVU, ATPase subunit HslU [Trypanosoma conorhini]